MPGARWHNSRSMGVSSRYRSSDNSMEPQRYPNSFFLLEQLEEPKNEVNSRALTLDTFEVPRDGIIFHHPETVVRAEQHEHQSAQDVDYGKGLLGVRVQVLVVTHSAYYLHYQHEVQIGQARVRHHRRLLHRGVVVTWDVCLDYQLAEEVD